MAVKETVISAARAHNIMPSITQVPASSAFSTSTPRVQSLQDWLDDFAKRRIAMAEYRKALAELAEEEIKMPKSLVVTKEEKTTRYLVDSETGVISVDEENGEYSYRDAQLVSSSIKARRGDYDQAITLVKALRGDQVVGAEVKRKEFYVEEGGEIVHDPENGEYTLSEARAVSQSRRALVPQDDNNLTKDRLEIWKRDLMEEITGRIKAMLPTGRDSELPFTIDENGEVQIDKNAKMSMMGFLLYNSLKAARRQEQLYKDKDGVVMDLPGWLELKRFEREERRKDEMNEAVTQLFQMGKKEIPGLIQGLRNMRTSKEAEEALEKGGWRGKGETKSQVSEVKTASCAGCSATITFTTSPTVLTCPRCGALNFIGTPVEFEMIKAELSSPAAGEGAGQEENQE